MCIYIFLSNLFVVFKLLELEHPKHILTDTILMAPRTSIQLKANLDDVLYRLSSDSNSIVKVSTDGIVRTHEALGRDLIIVRIDNNKITNQAFILNVWFFFFLRQKPLIRL